MEILLFLKQYYIYVYIGNMPLSTSGSGLCRFKGVIFHFYFRNEFLPCLCSPPDISIVHLFFLLISHMKSSRNPRRLQRIGKNNNTGIIVRLVMKGATGRRGYQNSWSCWTHELLTDFSMFFYLVPCLSQVNLTIWNICGYPLEVNITWFICLCRLGHYVRKPKRF